MKNEELLTIKYKGANYSLKELIQNENDFDKSLELPDAFNKDYSSFAWALQSDYGYMIANDKFEQFYSLLATARFTLTQAHKKLHKSPVEWRSGYLGQLWLRVQYLKNAIIWYNSCDDYLLQIIWFAFDFFNPHELKTQDEYLKVIRSCTWEKLISKLEKLEHNSNAVILLNEISKFRSINVRLKINDLANSLKHRANIHFKGLNQSDNMHFQSEEGFDSIAVRPILIDVDETCDLLQKVHVVNVAFAKFLIEFIDFESALPKEKDGVRNMNKAPSKDTYKKVFLKPVSSTKH